LGHAATTVDSAHPYAYGANVGWINARGDATNGAVFGQSFCTGFLWSANCGWIGLGNGPTNGWQYSNTASNDWGVNHDGEGRLTGYAYGANIGWVTFEQTHGQPRIDLRTGNLSGYAWGANVGWIGFSNSQAYVETMLSPGADTDGDGIPDTWERRRAGNTTTLGTGDADLDGTPDADEYAADTDPLTGEQLEITSLTAANGTNVVAWSSRPTRLYYVETTGALPRAAAPWADGGEGLIGPPASSPSVGAVPQAGQTSQFIRVRAVVPLSE
jgi:hypothetical protein